MNASSLTERVNLTKKYVHDHFKYYITPRLLLRNVTTGLGGEFKIKNQNGMTLEISKQDENYLTIAMILHEKGKLLIKSKDYIKALILLAEADNEFK